MNRNTKIPVSHPGLARQTLRLQCLYMPSGRLIRIPETLAQRLRRRSRMKGQPESALVREALETYLSQSAEPRPAYELAEEAGLIGCIGRVRKAPAKDLSTAPHRFK